MSPEKSDNSPRLKAGASTGLTDAVLPHSGCEVEDVDGSVGVPVQGCTAHRAEMPTLTQSLLGPIPAGMTVLRRIGGVDGNHFTSGALSLLREDGSEHRPGSVTDALGETVVDEQILDVQLFNGDHAKTVDDLAGGLVDKVMTTITDTLMDTRQNLVGLAPFTAALLGLGLLPASFCQRFFVSAEEARVVYKLTVGQSQKRVQPRVKTNSIRAWRQRGIVLLHRETDEPLVSDTMNTAGLDPADDEAVQFGLDLLLSAEQGQGDGAVTDLEPALWVAERVVPVALEAREARRLTCRHATEEGAVGQVNADGDVLENLAMDIAYIGELFAPLRKCLLLVVSARRLAQHFVVVPAPVQEAVVDLTTRFQRVGQFPLLPLRGEKPEL
jgi:hypothetical protein